MRLHAHVEPDRRVERGQLVDEQVLQLGAEVLRVLVGGEAGTRVGRPLVDGAKVVGTITDQGKARKITVFKLKRRKNYRRKAGHRQPYTEIRVEAIEG